MLSLREGWPAGLVYRPGWLAEGEERELLARFETLDFGEIRMRGQAARRTARHYGYAYDYERRGALAPGDPLPHWLAGLRGRAAVLAGIGARELAQALLQRYPPGATIGWHRDAPTFGIVVGVSLGASCRLRLRSGDRGSRFELELEPRSAYVLSGPARWVWQHSIPPTTALRYSITLRTLELSDNG